MIIPQTNFKCFRMAIGADLSPLNNTHSPDTLPSTACATFIVVSGLLGNTVFLILVAKYNALKVDKITKFLITFITVTDLSQVTLMYVPVMITCYNGGWALGETVCTVLLYINKIPFKAQVMFTALVCLYRFRLVKSKHPREEVRWRLPVLKGVMVFYVFILFAMSVGGLQTRFFTGAFTKNAGTCVPKISKPIESLMKTILYIVIYFMFMILPVTTAILSNIGIILFLLRNRTQFYRSRNYIVTFSLVLTSAIYIASFVPIGFQQLLIVITREKSEGDLNATTTLFFLLSLNAVTSPFIHLLTNKRYRSFLSLKATESLIEFKKCASQSSNRVSLTVPLSQSTSFN